MWRNIQIKNKNLASTFNKIPVFTCFNFLHSFWRIGFYGICVTKINLSFISFLSATKYYRKYGYYVSTTLTKNPSFEATKSDDEFFGMEQLKLEK